MAQLWTTGPAHIWVGVGGERYVSYQDDGGGDMFLFGHNNRAVYLGTAEDGPDIDITYDYEEVFFDGTGTVPHDRIYEGSEATISAVLTRWNEHTIKNLMSNPFYPGFRGLE